MSMKKLPNDNEKVATYLIEGEGHTLGNALSSIITTYKNIKFCGYNIPHPSENQMVFRVETFSGRADDTFKKGLRDVIELCDIVKDRFEHALDEYKQENLMDTS